MSETQTNDMPAFNAFVIVDRGKRQDPYWLKVGAAFQHKDGKGLNIVLQALPPDGRLVLRDYKENSDPENTKWLLAITPNSPPFKKGGLF